MRAAIISGAVPDDALLARYARRGDCYEDCFRTELPGHISHDAFITAFYTSWLFRLERRILALTGHPASDAAARKLALGETDRFAVWHVEARTKTEVLLADRSGATRSWLATTPSDAGTVLSFGSAVVPREPGGDLGLIFRALLGFHKVYSRALLRAASRKLM